MKELIEKLQKAIIQDDLPAVQAIFEQKNPSLEVATIKHLLNQKEFIFDLRGNAVSINILGFTLLNNKTAIANYLLSLPYLIIGTLHCIHRYSELDLALLADDTELTLRLSLERNIKSNNTIYVETTTRAYALYQTIKFFPGKTLSGDEQSIIAKEYVKIKDYEKAAKWATLSVKNNSETGRTWLADLYINHNNELGPYKVTTPLQEAVRINKPLLTSKTTLADNARERFETIQSRKILEEEKSNAPDNIDAKEAAYASSLILAARKFQQKKINEAEKYLQSAVTIYDNPTFDELRYLGSSQLYPEINGPLDTYIKRAEFFYKLASYLVNENLLFRTESLNEFFSKFSFKHALNQAISNSKERKPEFKLYIEKVFTEIEPKLKDRYQHLHQERYLAAIEKFKIHAKHSLEENDNYNAYHSYQILSYCYNQCAIKSDTKVKAQFLKLADDAEAKSYEIQHRQTPPPEILALSKAIVIYKKYDVALKESNTIENEFSDNLLVLLTNRALLYSSSAINKPTQAIEDYEMAVSYGFKKVKVNIISIQIEQLQFESALKTANEIIIDKKSKISSLSAILPLLWKMHEECSKLRLNNIEAIEQVILNTISMIFDNPEATWLERLAYQTIFEKITLAKDISLECKIKFTKLEENYKNTVPSEVKHHSSHQKEFVKLFSTQALFDRARKHETFRARLKPNGEPGRAVINYFLFLCINPSFATKKMREQRQSAENYLQKITGKPGSKGNNAVYAREILTLYSYIKHIDFYREVVCSGLDPHVFILKLLERSTEEAQKSAAKTFKKRYIKNVDRSHKMDPQWAKQVDAALKSVNAARDLLITKCLVGTKYAAIVALNQAAASSNPSALFTPKPVVIHPTPHEEKISLNPDTPSPLETHV